MNAKDRPDERPGLEAVLENVEAGVELVSGSEVIDAIPVVGTAFKVCKALDGLRERAMVAKLTRFVTDPSVAAPEVRSKIEALVREDAAGMQRIGETLFLVLDRMVDLDKPVWLARVFAGFVHGRIGREELLRLSQAIDLAFAADLQELATAWTGEYRDSRSWMQSLLPSGLTVQGVSGPAGGVLTFNLTTLGFAFQRAVRSEPS